MLPGKDDTGIHMPSSIEPKSRILIDNLLAGKGSLKNEDKF
jgi:hypothetical protein